MGNATRDAMVLPGKQYNLSEEEWNKLSREEQLRRMNEVAKEFNFFAKDKPDQDLTELNLTDPERRNIRLGQSGDSKTLEGQRKSSWCTVL